MKHPEIFIEIKSLTIGIDVGDKNTGIAVFDINTMKFVKLFTVTFWEAMFWMNALKSAREINKRGVVTGITLLIEDPAQNKPVFPIPSEMNMFKESFRKLNWELLLQALRMFSRRAQNIGANKKLASLMIDYANLQRFNTKAVRPTKKKMKADEFKRRTKYQERCSQHARDAAMIIYPF